MVTLKLTLKSKKPSNVYALNGKAYRLQPGANTLTLEYEDYLSLAKALGITPVPNPDAPKHVEEKPVEKPVVTERKSAHEDFGKTLDALLKNKDKHEDMVHTEEPVKNEEPEPVAETPNKDADEQPTNDEPAPVDDSVATNEPVEDNSAVDYSAMSYNDLKAEYKRITGNNCKLKKAEVIQFLQEHDSNV